MLLETLATQAENHDRLGIRLLKMWAGLNIIFVHCTSWIVMVRAESWVVDPYSIAGFLLYSGGFATLSLPAIAGAALRVRLDRYMVGDALCSFPMRQVYLLAASLALIDSVKSSLVWGLNYFFWFGPLHFVAVSLVLLTWLVRFSVRWLYAVGLLTLLAAPSLHTFLKDFQTVAPDEVAQLATSGFLPPALVFIGVAICAVAALFVWTSRWSFRVRLGASLTLAVALAVWILSLIGYQPTNSAFAANVFNLPFAALAGSPLRFHGWPIFPWFATVAFGFAICHERIKSPDRKQFDQFLFTTSALGFIAFVGFAWSAYLANVGQGVWWTERMFFPGTLVMCGQLLFIALAFMISGWFEVRMMRSKHAFVTSVIRPFATQTSESLIWIYLLSTSVGYWIATSPLTKMLPGAWALALITSLEYVLMLFLAFKFVRIWNHKALLFTFHPKLGPSRGVGS